MVPQHLAPIACPLCSRSLQACRCGTTPAEAPTMPKARTFVKMGEWVVCSNCQFAVQYCRCGELTAAEKPPEDGPATQSLAIRIAECKGK